MQSDASFNAWMHRGFLMRTGLDLNAHLLKAARRKTSNEGRTVTAAVEEGLRRLLARSRRSVPPYRGRLQPIHR